MLTKVFLEQGSKQLSTSLILQFSSVQLLSHVRYFMTPWTVTHQVSLSIANSWGLTQTHVHRIGDAIQSSHSLLSPSPHAFNLSQHQDLFQWVGSSYQVAKVLEFQLQHQSFQWIWLNHFPSWSCCTQFCIYRGRIYSQSKNWYSWDPYFMVNTYVGFVKTFIRIFHKILWRNSNQLFGQSNTTAYNYGTQIPSCWLPHIVLPLPSVSLLSFLLLSPGISSGIM